MKETWQLCRSISSRAHDHASPDLDIIGLQGRRLAGALCRQFNPCYYRNAYFQSLWNPDEASSDGGECSRVSSAESIDAVSAFRSSKPYPSISISCSQVTARFPHLHLFYHFLHLRQSCRKKRHHSHVALHQAACCPPSCSWPFCLLSCHGVRTAFLRSESDVMAPVWCGARLHLTLFIQSPRAWHADTLSCSRLSRQCGPTGSRIGDGQSSVVRVKTFSTQCQSLPIGFHAGLSQKPSSCLKALLFLKRTSSDICAHSLISSWSAGLTLPHVGDS